jgi:1-deoxy-D-xylulose-5-phosphate reductoisomerase
VGAPDVCRLIVLGSTGSIGTQTLQVVEHLNDLHAHGRWPTRYQVVGLAAGRNADLLQRQVERHRVCHVALGHLESDMVGFAESNRSFPWGEGYVGQGAEAVTRLIRRADCDLVLSAMSGAAGLPATLAAVGLGYTVALANKETLVAAGQLITAAAAKSGAKLLPVDSEHSGVWQCLDGQSDLAPPFTAAPDVHRVVLTASGGPFRTWTREQIAGATPEEALKHPTWTMGRKVTIDSASLMNKALEVIEAHWLFGLSADKIGVLVHPQSLIHAMVEFADGSVLTHLAQPDMKTPIQHALTWPRRAPGCSRKLPWEALRRLDFEEPDLERFPGLALASRAIQEGGAAGAVLNAANEAAAEAFLQRRIPFPRIAELVEQAMDRVGTRPAGSLEEVMAADRLAREQVEGMIGG